MVKGKLKLKPCLPVVLVIIDGWGISARKEGNAIAFARTPHYDQLMKKYPNTQLQAAGLDVGLSRGQDGNSEAGHLNIGAGRVVLQDAVYISRAINDGTFFKNPAFLRAVKHVQKHGSTLHLMGMLGNSQSAHANPDHLLALLTFAKLSRLPNIVLHIFTDGRDSPRFSAIKMVKRLEKALGQVRVGSVTGRYYAMDRALHWDRIKMVYDMLTLGKASFHARNVETAILQAYNRNESDEFIPPTLISPTDHRRELIKENDSIIFFNLRSDRARQLTKAFVQKKFPGFARKKVLRNLVFVAMTDFGPDLPGVLSAYPSRDVPETLPMALKAFRQLYISESEKYAHMTYFFNGGYDHPVGGEDRVSISSPKVPTYNLRPGMSTLKLVHYVKKDLRFNKHDFIAINFAAPDMVSHTGHFRASIKAVETVDKALGELKAAVFKIHGTFVVTADHGNIEELKSLTSGEVDTEHSNNPVPFILAGQGCHGLKLRKFGRLADIAPTILEIMDVPKPLEMTGRSLINNKKHGT
ncbi:2,3-bisphosphoglycerate-independent phosphoglycerate mutase [Candidatus Parcubacteria bacterium]|jgi:2,3-bisphosphoglycerate-independent phosphoglycerate mutase|nr:MAG: 2,3-bisphosphoglycerate-independent phosphoglycerate mutase [Candidatus Parcubacteria bacterium]